MPRALITGITGQDGRYLAELLIGKGYQVHGMIRGQNNPKARVVQDEIPEIELIDGDLTDLSSLIAAVEQVQPDEVYNLGAVSFVKLSFSQPELTADVSGAGVLRMLEAIRIVGGPNNRIRFYQAATSEMFGKVREVPQRETTPFHPRSPYGTAKVFGYYTTLNYRESYGIHASNGILFNHTQPAPRSRVRRTEDNQCGSTDIARPPGARSLWATSTRPGTSVTPATTSRPCGGWSSRTSPATMSSPPADWSSARSSIWHSRPSASTTGPLRRYRRPVPPPRRSRPTGRRPYAGQRMSWGGSPRPSSRLSWRKWYGADIALERAKAGLT